MANQEISVRDALDCHMGTGPVENMLNEVASCR